MKKCKSIILIDDDPLENLINRKLIVKLDITLEIKTLLNGHEGMNYLRILSQINTPPDLIFLDLNMPVMNGFEFLKNFQSLPLLFRKDLKVVVLTSSMNKDDYEKAQLMGCDGYLIKPLTKEKIREAYDKVFALD